MGQLDALLFKNTALLIRQRKSIILQLVFVIILCFIGGIGNLLSPHGVVRTDFSYTTEWDGRLSETCQTQAGTQQCGLLYWGYFVNPEDGAKLGDDPAGTLTKDSALSYLNSGALGNIPQYHAVMQVDDDIEDILAPFFDEASSASDVDSIFSETMDLDDDDDDDSTRGTTPNLAYLFDGIDYTKGSLSYTLQMRSDDHARYEQSIYDGYRSHRLVDVRQYAMSTLMTGFAEEAWSQNVTFNSQAANMKSEYWQHYSNGVLLWVFITITPSVMLLLPLFVLPVVIERNNKILSLNKLMGMRMRNYWLSQLVCNMGVYLFQLLVVVGFMIVFFIQAIWASGSVTITLFLLWGFTQVSLGMFIASLFSSDRTATLVAYLVTFLSILFGYPLNLWGFPNSWASFWYYLNPPWVYMRGFYLIQTAILRNDPITLYHGIFGEIAVVLLVLLLQAIVLFALAVYLEQVMPTSWGHRRPYLFPLYTLMHIIKKPTPYHYEPQESSGLLSAVGVAGEGDDVRAERGEALHADPSRHVMACIDVRKKFGDKAAVDNLSLTVEYDETLGLLGSNGAGKTTLISILCGMLIPTEGTAMVGGYDVVQQADLVQKAIGICPQFDILWDDLTVNEHLRFYFRMKGNSKQNLISSGEQLPIDDYDGEGPPMTPNLLEGVDQQKKPLHVRVSDLADLVGLSEHINKTASSLSGGNRRKLSIAIALVGDPKLVLLDEPSTGLDPEARREIWDIINEARVGRSFIITTHNMEECDALATKIAIMTHGKLACIGTQQNLKSRFGKGYTLSVTCQAGVSEHVVNSRLTELMPELQLEHTSPGHLHYSIDKAYFNISEIFNKMRLNKASVGVQDYGLAQSSLEDVFLRIIELEDAQNHKEGIQEDSFQEEP